MFHVALLAKRGWRLFNCPESLLACMLKAKYSKESDSMGSRLGSSPSFTMKSIWAAEGLLWDQTSSFMGVGFKELQDSQK